MPSSLYPLFFVRFYDQVYIARFSMNAKRKKVQDRIIQIIGIQEPGGYNVDVYTKFFDSLTDEGFDVWMKTLRDNQHCKLKLLVIPLKVVIKPEDSFRAAKLLGVEFLERLKMWDPIGKRYCMTPEKYFVLKLPVRRLKQYLMDGLSVPDSDRRLNPLTDQVVKPDKGSAISFPQAQMIAEKGLTMTLHELMSIRGGDLTAYAKMKSEIEELGYSDTSVMDGTAGVKSVSTLRTSFNALHLETNL